MLILGIESSCDETSAAVVRDGRQILSNVVATQIDEHIPLAKLTPASRAPIRPGVYVTATAPISSMDTPASASA